eukprot:732989-Karenia_brevis.AAC.1
MTKEHVQVKTVNPGRDSTRELSFEGAPGLKVVIGTIGKFSFIPTKSWQSIDSLYKVFPVSFQDEYTQ